MSNKHNRSHGSVQSQRPVSAETVNAALTTPIAETEAGDELAQSVIDGTAPDSITDAARDGNNAEMLNPFDAFYGVPEELHFTPQDATKGKTLSDNSIRRYLAKATAIGALQSMELTIASTGKIVTSPKDGTYEQQELTVWVPRGVTVAEHASGHFENWKQRVLNRFDQWTEDRNKRNANVVAIATTGARLIRKMPIQQASQS